MITTATLKDTFQLVTLINSAYRGQDSKKGWTTEADLLEGKRVNEEGIEKIINSPGSVILKYVNGAGDIIGCVYLKKNDNKMYLGMLTVSPALQASGMGKKIMLAAEEYAKEQKCDTMEMTVISVRNELIDWYNRKGYHDTGKRSPFPDDQLSMSKQPLEFIHLEKKL